MPQMVENISFNIFVNNGRHLLSKTTFCMLKIPVHTMPAIKRQRINWGDAHKFRQQCEFASRYIARNVERCTNTTVFQSSNELREHYLTHHQNHNLCCPHFNCAGDSKKQNWQNYMCHIQSVKGNHRTLRLVPSQWYCMLPGCYLTFSSRNALQQHFSRDFHFKKYMVVNV